MRRRADDRGADRPRGVPRADAAIRGMAVVAKRPDEGIEFSDGLCPLSPGQLDLVGQLLELLEGRPLIEWLRFWGVCHRD